MPDHVLTILNPSPGIQRDGTQYDSPAYIDGEWVRWYLNRPRKIGGMKLIDSGNIEIIRQLFVAGFSTAGLALGTLGQNQPGQSNLFIGRPSTLAQVVINTNGVVSPEVDRTPDDFADSVNNTWVFDTQTVFNEEYAPTSYLLALVNPNNNDINGDVEGPLYYGEINSISALAVVADGIAASGGVIALGPFVVIYGNDGTIQWSDSGSITSWTDSNVQSLTSGKLVAAFRIRGSGPPTGIFWSLNSVIRVSYNGTTSDWDVDILEDSITILSPGCVVKYNSIFYWIGLNQFYLFNGIVQELANTMNKSDFFDRLNIEAREKAWSIALPQWNEIWNVVPVDGSTEANWVYIYNIKAQIWYDTPLDRSCGIGPLIFPYPLMADTISRPNLSRNPVDGIPDNTYGIWMHEYLTDQYIYNSVNAIPSYFETNIITFFDQNPENDYMFRTRRIEPDFQMSGNMSVVVRQRAHPQGEVFESPIYTFSPTTNKIDTTTMGRLVSFKFMSNSTNGFYQAGKILINYTQGDERPNYVGPVPITVGNSALLPPTNIRALITGSNFMDLAWNEVPVADGYIIEVNIIT